MTHEDYEAKYAELTDVIVAATHYIEVSTDQPIEDITLCLLQEALENQHFVCLTEAYKGVAEGLRAEAVYSALKLALDLHLLTIG